MRENQIQVGISKRIKVSYTPITLYLKVFIIVTDLVYNLKPPFILHYRISIPLGYGF